jgi:hypothetical protein
MSARAIIIPSGPQLPTSETGASNRLWQEPPPIQALSPSAPGSDVNNSEDATEFTNELRRRYELPMPLPLPWPHGGLNE